jgi:hypothetical protein
MIFSIDSRAGTADYSLAKPGSPASHKTWWGGKKNYPVLPKSQIKHID